jgi:DNA-binding IscR family transcriptional regulator
MTHLLRSPRDFIFRAMRDFRNKNPEAPFMPVSLLAEQMRLPETQLEEILVQLHEAGMIELHPMWPTLREAWITEHI